MRKDRDFLELRPVEILPDVHCHADGSARIRMGRTIVLCTAAVQETVPKWLNTPGAGWVTAEYGMLPHAGDSRMNRERGFHSGRSQEISRLTGRSLRCAVPLSSFGERQILIDCDVLQADGGTRTAAVTGGFVALALALNRLYKKSLIPALPAVSPVAAVSVGIVNGRIFLDLNAKEDRACSVDMNFVMIDKVLGGGAAPLAPAGKKPAGLAAGGVAAAAKIPDGQASGGAKTPAKTPATVPGASSGKALAQKSLAGPAAASGGAATNPEAAGGKEDGPCFAEIQGAAEKRPFSRKDFLEMMEAARKGCARLFSLQKAALKEAGFPVPDGAAAAPETD